MDALIAAARARRRSSEESMKKSCPSVSRNLWKFAANCTRTSRERVSFRNADAQPSEMCVRVRYELMSCCGLEKFPIDTPDSDRRHRRVSLRRCHALTRKSAKEAQFSADSASQSIEKCGQKVASHRVLRSVNRIGSENGLN